MSLVLNWRSFQDKCIPHLPEPEGFLHIRPLILISTDNEDPI